MILTGKSLNDFGLFLVGIHKIASWEDFEKLPLVCQRALVVEWFDSVGIIIEISYSYLLGDKFYCLVSSDKKYINIPYCDTRLEVTTKAIEKANDIYNEKFK